MVLEVCALIVTIVVGVVGLELALWLRSVRQLTKQATETMKEINAHLPEVLEDAHRISKLLRRSCDQLAKLKNNPLTLLPVALDAIRNFLGFWQEIRKEKEVPDR